MMNNKSKRLYQIIIAILIILMFQRCASIIGDFVADMFEYDIIDPDKTFAWISVHHIVQMLVAIIAILIIHKYKRLNFGFNYRNKKLGFKYLFVFSFVILIYVLLSYMIGYSLGTIQAYNFPLHLRNVIGTLSFQLLLSGTSEEILFRALPITIISYFLSVDNKMKFKKIELSTATVITAILFSIAHISFSLPSLIISVNWFQLFYAFILGIVYGVTYEKTKCIVYPMAMHGISNFVMVGIGYIFMVIFQ